MNTEQILTVLAVVTAANMALAFTLVATRLISPLVPAGRDPEQPPARPDAETHRAVPGVRSFAAEADVTAAYERVARVVGYAVLLVTAVIVAVSGLWPDAAPLIYVAVAVTGITIFTINDLIPRGWLGRARYPIEAAIAIAFVTVMVGATGGVRSPFFVGYYLIVTAAVLAASEGPAIFLGAGSAAALLVVAFVAPGVPAVGPEETARVAVELAGLILLAYLALVLVGEQRRARDAAVRLSLRDALTGLANRAALFRGIDREIQRAARTGRGFCLLMIDLDDLKPINDRLGHPAGDAVLRSAASSITATIRRVDMAARYGGDEFIVLLPETDPVGASIVAEKIRSTIATIALPAGKHLPTTASIGVVGFPGDGETADALMAAADSAMYTAKRLGKDRVVLAGSGPISVTVPRTEAPWSGPGSASGIASTDARPPGIRHAPGDRHQPLSSVADDDDERLRRAVESLLAGSEAGLGPSPGETDRAREIDRARERRAGTGDRPRPPLGSARDALTGLRSRAAWQRQVRAEHARSLRYRRPITAGLVDLDGLADLARRDGEETADRAVQVVGQVIRAESRASDLAGRLDVDRLGFLLPETDEAGAQSYLERIRASCQRWLASSRVPLDLAVGWGSPGPEGSLEPALVAAEERLRDDRHRRDRPSEAGRPRLH